MRLSPEALKRALPYLMIFLAGLLSGLVMAARPEPSPSAAYTQAQWQAEQERVPDGEVRDRAHPDDNREREPHGER